jgi:hypothetical protein
LGMGFPEWAVRNASDWVQAVNAADDCQVVWEA